MNKQTQISFIGGGNMAASLIAGLIANGHPADCLRVSDPNPEALAALARFGIRPCASNAEAVSGAQVVVLAVKPQVMAQVALELAAAIQATRPLVLSIAAGVREASLLGWLGADTALVRTMPNTPAMIQAGASGLHASAQVSTEQASLAESIMRAVGLIQWVEEETMLDVVTALSGSGPAYFFLMMEVLEQAAVEQGLPQETARLLTLQTALGAARMALESEDSTERLRHKVTSPGGTTEQAINTLEEGDFRQLLGRALANARLRSEQLSGLMDSSHG
ncbi:MAG: pyrroline-5-carboxylate reductase [Gammaproteobacteria bacterium SHHR-1]|uniref:pyrroline-5-carboxylate reductase n=1 Tax=Magnetovirga frankeli TaxID=947516 RepID=UPI001294041C|nr:pyrroline-5-carboxylate reductase [gamma proteobacterium SS-5]